jgi:hypothetical protein
MYLFLLLLLLILFLFFLKNIYYICVRHETRYIVLSIWRFQWWRDQPTHNECIKWKYPQRCEISTYQGRQVHQGSPINWGNPHIFNYLPAMGPLQSSLSENCQGKQGWEGKEEPSHFWTKSTNRLEQLTLRTFVSPWGPCNRLLLKTKRGTGKHGSYEFWA